MGGYGLVTERVHYRATLYNNYETEKKLQHFIGSSEYGDRGPTRSSRHAKTYNELNS